MDPSFWALDLGGPVKVTSTGPKVLPDCGPTAMVSTFEFGQRGKLSPCKVVWYEGEAGTPEEFKDLLPMNGSLFIGDDGMISAQHGEAPVLHKNGESQKQVAPRSLAIDITTSSGSTPAKRAAAQVAISATRDHLLKQCC